MALVKCVIIAVTLTCCQSISSCIQSTNVVNNYNITQNIINDGWTRCYFEPYSTHSNIVDLLANCSTGDQIYVFVGALQTSTSTLAYLGAFAPSEVLTLFTPSQFEAYIPPSLVNELYNVYWYNYQEEEDTLEEAFGFAPDSTITADYPYGGDDYVKSSNSRLSWSMHKTYGGYRAGSYIELRNDNTWHKVIYYKQCTDSTPPVNSNDPCIMENNVVHNYHIESNLVARGWTNCYFEPYNTHSSISTLITQCPIADDIQVFVGALSTHRSTYAYIGAYAPSIVISSITSSIYTAEIPVVLKGTGYNVYWYNYYKQSFGFSSTATVDLTSAYGGDYEDAYLGGPTAYYRLSWSTENNYGGYRAGNYINLRSADNYLWQKVIYYKECAPIVPDPVNDSSCIMSNNIVYNYHLETYLIHNGWIKCYDETYSTHSGIEELLIACGSGNNRYVFIGATPNTASTFATLGAFAPISVLTDGTMSATTAKIPNILQGTGYNVYWYNYYAECVGFSPRITVDLDAAFGGDYEDAYGGGPTADGRLSWSLQSDYGGYRAGIYYDDMRLNNEWRKIVYYKDCATTIEPNLPMDGNCIMNNVVHEWNIKANLIDQGWSQCYRASYSEATRSVINIGCPNGTDIYVFVGVLSINQSTEAIMGAYAPSEVLYTATEPVNTAYLPSKYANDASSSYNVYWYNVPDAAFGFSPTSTVDVTAAYGGDYEDAYNGGPTANDRLSWSLKSGYGGYRAGIWYNLGSQNNYVPFQKVIYYKHCPSTESPTAAPIDSSISSSNPTSQTISTTATVPIPTDPTGSTNGPSVITSLTPSLFPSLIPSLNPSARPTIYPNANQTFNAVVTEKSSDTATKTQNLDELFRYVAAGTIGVTAIIGSAGYIHAKYITVNDFFKIGAFIKIAFHLLDMSSDIFFAVQVYIQTEEDNIFWIIFILCVTFVILPIIVTVAQLFRAINKQWMNNDQYKLWLEYYTIYLMICSVFLGSSFAAIELFNSNLFSLDVFGMNLNRKYLLTFRNGRMWSIILIENIPQLIIQTYFAFILDPVNTANFVTIASVILSIISIIVTILTICVAKRLLFVKRYGILKFDITGQCIIDKNDDNMKYVYKIKGIRKHLSNILGIQEMALEMLQPQKISNGWKLEMYIHDNKNECQYEKNVNDANDGTLSKMIKKEWELDDEPLISNIQYTSHDSGNDNHTKDTANVEMDSLIKLTQTN